MPWEKLKPAHPIGQTATLRGDGIALASEFIRSNGLAEYDWVELFIHDTMRRIGFKFHDVPTAHTLKLLRESEYGRVIVTRTLRQYPWIANILKQTAADRRFLVETDESIRKPTGGVRYSIFVGYRFYPKREFGKQGDYPRMAGVYRLFKEGEIVRIGESDSLEDRLKDHYASYKDEVDEYDFAEINDHAARKSEEKRLLAEHKDAYGRLPGLNRITS